jgi:hypothetical protein
MWYLDLLMFAAGAIFLALTSEICVASACRGSFSYKG